MINLFFFDMDHTLIDLDCDVSWKQFLIAEAVIPHARTMDKVDYFYESYVNGNLDYDKFLDFQLEEIKGKTVKELEIMSNMHFNKYVKHKIYSSAKNEVKKALASGKRVSILSATNTAIVKPLAQYLGIEDIVATELEIVDGVYSGKIKKAYCCGEGKLIRATEYCEKYNISLDDSAYYGDSYSDRFILASVGHPVVVNPSDLLEKEARINDWPILSF